LNEVYAELLHHNLRSEEVCMLVDGYVQHALTARGPAVEKTDIPRMKKVYKYAYVITSACAELTATDDVDSIDPT
jgi:hypothetical protein